MSVKRALIAVIVVLIIVASMIVTVIYRNRTQNLTPQAQENNATSNLTASQNQTPPPPPQGATGSSCSVPDAVENVFVDYPNCQGTQCNFNQASCSWDAVSGATNYSVKITEVDTNTVLKTETLSSSTNRYDFGITQNRTYQCDVSAVNSCGQSGPVGTGTALCAADAITGGPTPPPPPPTTTSPPPPPPATPPAAPIVKRDCAYPCSSDSECNSGLTCVTVRGGKSYCAIPAYAEACKADPYYNTCCQAPVAKKNLPVAGDEDKTVILSVIGGVLLLIGAVGVMLFN